MKLSHLSLLACLFASAPTLALSTDTQQPIHINSDSLQLDMKNNRVTYISNVKLVQGSININAERLVVIRNPENGKIEQIEGYGNPATFSQLTDEGKTLHGQAKQLYYKMADDELLMIGQAMLAQDDSEIRGQQIRYQISSQKLIADGQGSERVSTILQPQAVQQD
ncbi:lipopolysaccharide transport periplasmic protein LptA [Vibrio metschnikovii]|uniref:Lipopolysaccharide export system protein LptA n=8 Tax=Bacteria TaxID=2 RepID=A0A9X0R8X5_VIBME|nr:MULTISPECIES: lipopolysaccharide transport periplasmic protein LptA [Vibrio]EKO3558423.1 lipopolysaccharide transport periplasmic protein LptA [Vibrio metschnikovii]EKO3564818.1 lipopolysaccharide transport periplasmic protein LptA [Vibrio metschnikovii]EKO3568415.1 lipopolysaccharide transport periplasmic protein LptA [Vibrio metschnikovii]EKO3572211.1 lipopolysaccharide transport periplasmic protein LptA [Vibrio metschnikovii]EKO3575585.1 lipopolysaccharide transport periplasmic protein L